MTVQQGLSEAPPQSTTEPHHGAAPSGSILVTCTALVLGMFMSLTVTGYEFGKSNHTVYLLDAYRRLDPQLLANDWFTNATLQYHGLFTWLTRVCMSLGVIEPVFLLGYLATVAAFHVFAYRIVRNLCGPDRAETPGIYLLSVVFLHLSAGGTGLGGFQFLQDAAFLPSNIANVAMLGGIAMLMEARLWLAGALLGVSGVFHINHAVFAPLVMLAGLVAQPGRDEDEGRPGWLSPVSWRGWVGPLVLLAALVGANLLPAMAHLWSESARRSGMPLAEFVSIYGRLRHPHHYYPPAWHPAAWIAPTWSLFPAALLLALRHRRLPLLARRVMFCISGMLAAAILVAVLFAGVMFVSERLVQMAVFRFSIYLIYFGCVVTAWGLLSGLRESGLRESGRWFVTGLPVVFVGLFVGAYCGVGGQEAMQFVRDRPGPLAFTIVLSGAMVVGLWTLREERRWVFATTTLACGIALLGGWGVLAGLRYIPEDPPAYIALARWARDHTPKDAVFVVPPQEQSWRLEARRAVVINFKAIPQTATEMPGWRDRMQDVTGVRDLVSLAGTFDSALARIARVYQARSADDLIAVAEKYGARYIVATRDLADSRLTPVGPVDSSGSGLYRLYDLGPHIVAVPPEDVVRP